MTSGVYGGSEATIQAAPEVVNVEMGQPNETVVKTAEVVAGGIAAGTVGPASAALGPVPAGIATSAAVEGARAVANKIATEATSPTITTYSDGSRTEKYGNTTYGYSSTRTLTRMTVDDEFSSTTITNDGAVHVL